MALPPCGSLNMPELSLIAGLGQSLVPKQTEKLNIDLWWKFTTETQLLCLHPAKTIDSLCCRDVHQAMKNHKYATHRSASWQSQEEKANQTPTMLKLCMFHPSLIISTLPMALLVICRHQSDHTPGMPIFEMISSRLYLKWVLAPSSYLLILPEDLGSRKQDTEKLQY